MFIKIIKRIISLFNDDNDECFYINKDNDNKCYGVLGGDNWSDYLCYSCINCKHRSSYFKL